jgi:hypothetical protein
MQVQGEITWHGFMTALHGTFGAAAAPAAEDFLPDVLVWAAIFFFAPPSYFAFVGGACTLTRPHLAAHTLAQKFFIGAALHI